MRINSVMPSIKNNNFRSFSTNKENNKISPSFGNNNYSNVGCFTSAVAALALTGGTIAVPIVVFLNLQDNKNELIERNIAKGDSLITDYKTKLAREKAILTDKTYPADKFMKALKDIGDGKDGITYQNDENYEYSENIPIFVEEMRNFEQKIYNQLPQDKKELLDSIKTNLTTNGGLKSKNLNIPSEKATTVKESSLAMVDGLLLLSQLGEIYLDNEFSQKAYNKIIFDIANQYSDKNFDPASSDQNTKILQNLRDNIANNMTPEEKQAYERKYEEKLTKYQEEITKQVKELNKDYNSPFSTVTNVFYAILSSLLVLVLGVPAWLIITDAFDSAPI